MCTFRLHVRHEAALNVSKRAYTKMKARFLFFFAICTSFVTTSTWDWRTFHEM